MGSSGRGGSGLRVDSGSIRLFPVQGTITENESRGLRNVNAFGEGADNEYGILADRNGVAQLGYAGERHSVAIDERVLQSDGIFTHRHPNNYFGGSFSMTDLGVFAKSNLRELRAFSKQGQLYSIRGDGDKKALAKWVSGHKKLYQQNFNNTYDKALKEASTPLKSGPNKGKVKLTDRRTGKVTYKNPMTPKQADAYARMTATGALDRTYKKNLAKFGFTYVKTKAGR